MRRTRKMSFSQALLVSVIIVSPIFGICTFIDANRGPFVGSIMVLLAVVAYILVRDILTRNLPKGREQQGNIKNKNKKGFIESEFLLFVVCVCTIPAIIGILFSVFVLGTNSFFSLYMHGFISVVAVIAIGICWIIYFPGKKREEKDSKDSK